MYVYCLYSTIALCRVKSHLLTILQSLVAICYNTRKMYEHLFASCIVGNESVAFFAIEPFDLTFHKKVFKC